MLKLKNSKKYKFEKKKNEANTHLWSRARRMHPPSNSAVRTTKDKKLKVKQNTTNR